MVGSGPGRRGSIYLVPECGTPSQGTGHARTLRETNRRRLTQDRRELRPTSAEIGCRGAARRTTPGTKYTCGAAVRCARGGKCPGVHATALDEGGELAGVGAPK